MTDVGIEYLLRFVLGGPVLFFPPGTRVVGFVGRFSIGDVQ